MKLIDLHVHTTESDGTLSPGETVEYAAKKGLSAIAVTDHDTTGGVKEAAAAGLRLGVELIAGIEVSTDYKGHGVHILGYFVDPDSEAMQQCLAGVIAEREARNERIVRLMQRDGLDISREELHRMFPGGVIGRPHFGAWLVSRGLAKDVNDAFARYLNRGCPYYQRREYLSISRGVGLIRQAGGKAVFAHPLQYRMSEEERLELVKLLCSEGISGIECLYSGYTARQSEYLMDIARRFGLCVTGGSDFHGSRKPNIDMGSGTGELRVPYELLEKLREC